MYDDGGDGKVTNLLMVEVLEEKEGENGLDFKGGD